MTSNDNWSEYTNAIRTIPSDITLEFQDGRFGIVSSIAMARSPVIARMLDGTFKEGSEKVINFPDDKVNPMRFVFNYILYNEKYLDVEPEELVEIYAAADKYNVLPLMSACIAQFMRKIRTPECLRVYASCNEILGDIKKEAAEQMIDFMRGGHIRRVCDACKRSLISHVKCTNCGINTLAYRRENIKCQGCSHVNNIAKGHSYVCTYMREGKKCGIKLTEVPVAMDTAGVPDDVHAEIFTKYVNVLPPAEPKIEPNAEPTA
jgi:hypothetical protein